MLVPVPFRTVLASSALLGLAAGCSSTSSGGAAAGDAGTEDGATTAFTYTPQGCAYTYSPPARLGFQGLALDDSGPVSAPKAQPQRVRVGLGGDTTKGKAGYADPATSAAFTWESAESNHAAKLKIGTSATALTQIQTGYAWTLPPGIGTADTYFHEVHICGLTAGATYFYQVGGGPTGSEVWSATQSFTTLPTSGTITVGVFGDARDQVSTWQAVNTRMRDPMMGVAMSLVGGDVVDIGAEQVLYDQWLDAIWQPNGAGQFLTLGQMLILPINGNHENDTATSFANWALPGTSSDPYAETYASFDVGNTHFAMIDDEQIASSPKGAEAVAQLAWLDADLAAANADRTNHPFIVVIGHRCMFSTSTHGTDPDVLATRGVLVPLYDKHSVDLVINGHDHDYERSLPLKAGPTPSGAPLVGAGTTYVVSAGAGADAYATGTPAAFTAKSVAYGSGTSYIGSYSLLTLSGKTLTLTAYGLKASSTTVGGDDMIDTFTATH